MMRPLVSILLLTALTLAPACSTNPATGQRQLNVLGQEQEIALGNEAAPQFIEDYGGPIPSESIRRYVSDLGQRLAAVSERPDLPWEFHVVDSAVINAFALPGGKVFMSRGLLEKMDSEAQLAGVLGHEIGHVTAMHINDRMAAALGFGVLGAAIGIAGEISDEDWMRVLGVGVGVAGTGFQLKFSRDDESQADELGVRYMAKLGYNPIAQIQVMEILGSASGAGGGPPELLSTHPLPATRIRRLEALIRDRYPNYDDPRAYSFHHDRFQQNVLSPLKELPAAAHTGQ